MTIPALPPLEPPDSHHLRAVEGWLELGNIQEAGVELRRLRPELLEHPLVLEVRWKLHSMQKDWEVCLELANELLKVAPDRPSGWIDRSFSYHELKRTREAWQQLLPATQLFPDEPIIRYNLACYACQLGNLSEAKQLLKQAQALGHAVSIKRMALDDHDLEPLWEEIKEL